MIRIRGRMQDGSPAEIEMQDMGRVPYGGGFLTEFLVNGQRVTSASNAETADGRLAHDFLALDHHGVDVFSLEYRLVDGWHPVPVWMGGREMVAADIGIEP